MTTCSTQQPDTPGTPKVVLELCAFCEAPLSNFPWHLEGGFPAGSTREAPQQPLNRSVKLSHTLPIRSGAQTWGRGGVELFLGPCPRGWWLLLISANPVLFRDLFTSYYLIPHSTSLCCTGKSYTTVSLFKLLHGSSLLIGRRQIHPSVSFSISLCKIIHYMGLLASLSHVAIFTHAFIYLSTHSTNIY